VTERQLQHLVDALAERLGRSVVLDDPEVNLLAASRHYGDADEQRVRAVLQRDVGGPAIGHILEQGVARWTSPGVIPARDDLGMRSRLCHAVRWHGQLLGLLLVIDADQSMTEDEVGEVVRAGNEIATLLLGEQLGQDHRRRELENALSDLLGESEPRRQGAVRVLDRLGVLHRGAWVTVTGVELDDRTGATLEATEATLALRIATASVSRSRAGYAASAVLGERGVLLQTWDRQPAAVRLREQAAELRDAVGRVLGEQATPVAAVGRVREGLLQAHRAYHESLVALRAARRIPSLQGLALADELGPLDVVLRVPGEELTESLVPEPLLRLRDHDPQGKLLETLRVYLDHAGSSPAAAEALNLHRTSLYYRLERIEEFTGLSLGNGRHRLLLHLGLHILDSID
jgi:sugar diacid utilization regulator